jgi:hypothetical protein
LSANIESIADDLSLDWPEDIRRNFIRNRDLIWLDNIPENVSLSILSKYNEEAGKSREKLLDYFWKNKLRNLLESISEF